MNELSQENQYKPGHLAMCNKCEAASMKGVQSVTRFLYLQSQHRSIHPNAAHTHSVELNVLVWVKTWADAESGSSTGGSLGLDHKALDL